MSLGVVASKCGMTTIFEEGNAVPVTVLQVDPNVITQLKTEETDGYTAIQVTTGKSKLSRVSKPLKGHFAKAGVEPGRGLWEFNLEGDLAAAAEKAGKELTVGAEITAELFNAGDYVDVTSVSKGKGFAGVVKRWNFKTQDATHGNSLSHRAPGSIGQNQTPGRVFKGKKMAGQMGNKQVTVQSQKIVRVDSERNLILLKGAVPGAKGAEVIIKPAEKMRNQGESK